MDAAAGAFLLLSIFGYKVHRESDIKQRSASTENGDTDEVGASVKQRIERDLRAGQTFIPQVATALADRSVFRLDPKIKRTPAMIRKQAMLKRNALDDITIDPWKHRPVRAGIIHQTVNDGRHGFHSLSTLNSQVAGITYAPRDNAPGYRRKAKEILAVNLFELRK